MWSPAQRKRGEERKREGQREGGKKEGWQAGKRNGKSTNQKWWWRREREALDTAGGNVDWSKSYENQYEDASGLKADSPCDLGSPILMCTQRVLSQHITEAHTVIPLRSYSQPPSCSSGQEPISRCTNQENMVSEHNEVWFSIMKERSYAIGWEIATQSKICPTQNRKVLPIFPHLWPVALSVSI